MSVKVVLDYWDGQYSTRQLENEDPDQLQKLGYCVVNVSEEKFSQWIKFLAQTREWHNYWSELDRQWHEENFPDNLS